MTIKPLPRMVRWAFITSLGFLAAWIAFGCAKSASTAPDIYNARPEAPSGVYMTFDGVDQGQPNRPVFHWTDNSSNETGFRLRYQSFRGSYMFNDQIELTGRDTTRHVLNATSTDFMNDGWTDSVLIKVVAYNFAGVSDTARATWYRQ